MHDFILCLYMTFVTEPVAARYFFEYVNQKAQMRVAHLFDF